MKKSVVPALAALLATAALLLALGSCSSPLMGLEEDAVVPLDADAQGGLDASRAVTLWYLEDYMKNATSLSTIYGVYWSARDMDSSPIGNHQFITIVYGSKAQADAVAAGYGVTYKAYANQKGLMVYYTTIGAFTDDGSISGNIIEVFNQVSDADSVKEQVNPAKYIYWWKPDYDFEGHRVPYSLSTRGYASTDAFLKAIIVAAKNFNRNHDAGLSVQYSLFSTNCSTMVNSLFAELGIPAGDRDTLGDFFGVDAAEDNVIAGLYFR